MIYVGERESDFTNLVDTFTYRVAFIALICLAVAGVIAIPIARLIVRPIIELVAANRHLERGDMSVRVHPAGSGEIALLGRSFNSMVETLEETQRALAQKEKLASMGQLAAGVAHELNNPLGTILLYSDVMYRDAAEDDQRREDLKMIIDEAYRCKTIVADLLNFARDQEIMVQDTNLNALITNLVEKSRRGPRFGKLELVCLLDQHLPIIHADPDPAVGKHGHVDQGARSALSRRQEREARVDSLHREDTADAPQARVVVDLRPQVAPNGIAGFFL